MTGTRRLGAGFAAVALAVGLGALAAKPALRTAGALVVAEDPPGPADVVLVSNAAAKDGALEAAKLWREGLADRVVVAPWEANAVDARLDALGVHPQRPEELVEAVLRAAGVPPDRVERLPAATNGTRAEVQALAALVRAEGVRRVLFVTARTHTARARWLLQRALPGNEVSVRSAETDGFDPTTWWRHRSQARELAMEYLRWASTLLSSGG